MIKKTIKREIKKKIIVAVTNRAIFKRTTTSDIKSQSLVADASDHQMNRAMD